MTRKTYCSDLCNKQAYYLRNKARLLAQQKVWAAANPDKVREIRLRFNRTTKAKAYHVEWNRRHSKLRYESMKGPELKALVETRRLSRRVLLQHVPKKACVCLPPHEGRIECHHKDHDPFNRAPENLEWRCVKHHRLIHPAKRRAH